MVLERVTNWLCEGFNLKVSELAKFSFTLRWACSHSRRNGKERVLVRFLKKCRRTEELLSGSAIAMCKNEKGVS